ncbi:metal-dependent hydrolase [Aurantiacibacter poecillastricola]|uniref:metal-dependent hydrolase n=1 Tax=Aurantiacibacter poecillastricola TaxID=3064385 RepID=UPI00273DA633|nr:metal-dependent hydrolase [Aurantiacibacter sp. 219JJ12-13]MDP5261852.1 metal-dependent hydrolase [Aurantiacibacter sp. 219JJ12-13]
MDNLTHSLTGALIGQAGLKKKTGLAMPALIIGANLPDVDAACFFWLEGVEHLAFRRGITHGPIALVMLPLVLAGLLWGWDRWQAIRGKRPEGRLPVHFGWLYGVSLIGCLTHPTFDWLNVYGIRLLEPFSSRWFYGDVLFIIDVWLWALLIGGTWLSRRREKRGGDWKGAARIALTLCGIYLIANYAISEADRRNNRAFAETISSPPPLAFWERESIGVGGSGSYFIDGERVGNTPLSACDLESARARSEQVRAFLFWSRAPVVTRLDDGSYLLGDARYYGVEDGRFSVTLPEGLCSEPGTR